MAVAEHMRIVSVRFRHPTQNRDIEVRFDTEEYRNIDAVFTTVDAFERILLPFYQGARHDEGEDLRHQVEEQRQDDSCFVAHRYPCGGLVPYIDWDSSGPIRL